MKLYLKVKRISDGNISETFIYLQNVRHNRSKKVALPDSVL